MSDRYDDFEAALDALAKAQAERDALADANRLLNFHREECARLNKANDALAERVRVLEGALNLSSASMQRGECSASHRIALNTIDGLLSPSPLVEGGR